MKKYIIMINILNRNRLWLFTILFSLIAVFGVIVASDTASAADAPHYWVPVTGSGSGNYSDVNHWSASDDGTPDVAYGAPDSDDSVYFNANSFTGVGQAVTVIATSYCGSMDWTGATNTPTLATGGSVINYYGDITLISAMALTGTTAGGGLTYRGTGANTFDSGGCASIGCVFQESSAATGSLTLINNGLTITNTGANAFLWQKGTFSTGANLALTVTGGISLTGTSATATFGSSAISCNAFSNTCTTLTVTANTATINVSGTGVGALSTVNYNGASFNFKGTAHTISGSPTGIATFTRTGTATNANSIIFTSGTTITCTTFAMVGNSRANQLHVITTIIGSPVTIGATNWTGTTNCDLMDITATNAVDFSAAGLNILTIGNGGGNTGITFPAAVAQTWNGSTGSASTSASWTSRIPLVGIDDVTIPTTGATFTNNMPRMGKSITVTGTGTVILSQSIRSFGSLTLGTGITYTHNNNSNLFQGRDAFTLNTGGKTLYDFSVYAPTGTLTFASDVTTASGAGLFNGTLALSTYNLTCTIFSSTGSGITRVLNLGSSTITLNSTAATTKWNMTATGLTLTSGTSTIILTNSLTNAQTFAGGSLTYNNVTQTGAGDYDLTMTGNNIFNNIELDTGVANKGIKFPSSGTIVITGILVLGNGSRLNASSSPTDVIVNCLDVDITGSVDINDIDWVEPSSPAGLYYSRIDKEYVEIGWDEVAGIHQNVIRVSDSEYPDSDGGLLVYAGGDNKVEVYLPEDSPMKKYYSIYSYNGVVYSESALIASYNVEVQAVLSEVAYLYTAIVIIVFVLALWKRNMWLYFVCIWGFLFLMFTVGYGTTYITVIWSVLCLLSATQFIATARNN